MSETKLFAVTGNPILHSKSPCMFNNAFEVMNLEARYIRIAADSAKEAIYLFNKAELSGMNVTAPFKEDIMPFLDIIDDDAQKIGSVNTVVKKDGKLIGYNTDHYGVANSIIEADICLKDINAVVIGAGGAGKAAAFGLVKNGAKVTIVNRTLAKAKAAAQIFGCKYDSFDNLKSILNKNTLIVFSLSQNVNPIKNKWLNKNHLIFDANYKNSPFKEDADKIGYKIINGENWLLNQAIPAFRLFMNLEPDHDAMKNGLEMYDLDKKLNKISMIGFMATGKTKNSILLSQLLDRPAIDSDEMIVEKENKTIPEIFEKHGEPYFRELEKNTLKQIFEMNGSHIISCGGGIVLNKENRNYLRSQSLVIWLFASPEAIVARLKPGKRPLLEVADPLAKAKELLGQRLHYYAQTADILISTERNLKELTTEKIYDEINITFGNKR